MVYPRFISFLLTNINSDSEQRSSLICFLRVGICHRLRIIGGIVVQVLIPVRLR